MSEIDPVKFGELMQAVKILTEDVNSLNVKVENLVKEFTDSKGMVKGFKRGFLVAVALFSGGLGATAYEFVKHIFKQ